MKLNRIFSLALVLSMLLSSCMAAVTNPVASVDFHTTLEGMISAAKGVPGTLIYSDGKLFLLGWPQKAGYGFVVLSGDGNPVKTLADLIGNGQKVNIKNMVDLLKFLEARGWTSITPDKLPVAFSSTLLSAAARSLAAGSKALTTIFILPVGMVDGQPWKPEVVQE